MSVLYSQIIETILREDIDVSTVDKVHLTRESMTTFIADDNGMTDELQERQEEKIGKHWEFQIKLSDDNYIQLDNGSVIRIE